MRKKDDIDLQGEKAKGEMLVYQSDDGKIRLDVRLEQETLWMTQSDMARLFQCSADNISLHLKNIYDERDLDPSSTTEEFLAVRQEGARQVQRNLTFYNLDAETIKQLRRRQWPPGATVAIIDLVSLESPVCPYPGRKSDLRTPGGVLPGTAKEHRSNGLRTLDRIYASDDSRRGFLSHCPPSRTPSHPPSRTPLASTRWGDVP
jgi:hypothetical protein